jgi:outer membrane protein W
MEQDTSSSKYSYGIQYYLVNGIFFAFKFNDNYPNVWRVKFDLSGAITGDSYNEKPYYNGELGVERENGTNTTVTNFSISFEFNYFFNIHNQFDPYIGIGPLFKYSRDKYSQESKNLGLSNSSTSYETVNSSYGIGLIGVAGVESKVIDFISLFIEYNLSYTYNWTNIEANQNWQPSDSHYESERDGNSWAFNISSAKIGIILYF